MFGRKSNASSESQSVDDTNVKSSEPQAIRTKELKPIPFFALFRFSTKWELFLDFIGLIAACAAGAAQPLMTLFMGKLTQKFIEFMILVRESGNADSAHLEEAAQNFKNTAAMDAGYICFIGVGLFICTYMYMYIWVYTGETSTKRLRERCLRAVLRQELAFFDNVGAGELASLIQSDSHLVQQSISTKVVLVAQYISTFATGFIIAYIRSWRLALALTSMLPCIMIASAIMNYKLAKSSRLAIKHLSSGANLAEEVISTVRTAHAFGNQRVFGRRYDEHVEKAHQVALTTSLWHGACLSVLFFTIYSGYALAFHYGTELLDQGRANAGIIVNVISSLMVGSFSLSYLSPELQAITKGRAAAAKIYDIIERVPVIDSSNPAGLKPDTIAGEITFENVSFNYPSRPDVPVVKDLSLVFPAGKSAALVGASGSGKSTIVSLIERFYDPLSGCVKIDGVDVRDLNLKWLRSQIGLVSQEPKLFSTTIRANVAHGLIGTQWENASEEEQFPLIKEACIKANALDFITKLPQGFDTMVGQGGFLLSGGQKQRIAIATAIVSDPKILLFDEATSALDTKSEGIVQNALDKAAAGRTTISIAHRLSAIKNADKIFVMGDGVVLEQGTNDELLKNKTGVYSQLVEAQNLRGALEQKPSTEYIVSQEALLAASSTDIDEKASEEKGRSFVDLDDEKNASGLPHLPASDTTGSSTHDHSLWYVFKRMGQLNQEALKYYIMGAISATVTGMIYPVFGILFADGIVGLSYEDPAQRKAAGEHIALIFFILSLVAGGSLGMQTYHFTTAAGIVTRNLRSISFKAILRRDIRFFDEEENNTGALVTSLSDSPTKVSGLAGITLGVIVQGLATMFGGAIIGLIYAWKIALVAMACIPLLVATGFIRLHVVILKDQANKKAHGISSQLACEAIGSVRTVMSLTREDDCCKLYSEQLDQVLKQSNRKTIWSNLLFAMSQSVSLFVLSLVFWYGCTLVASREFSSADFFVALMSTTFGAIQTSNIFAGVPDISFAKAGGSDIIKLVDFVSELDTESTSGDVPDLKANPASIDFEDVHFNYPTRPNVPVLRGLTLRAEPGSYIAVVGSSGSGKSTVMQLIERFYNPKKGEISLGGTSIARLNIQHYRKQMAMVSQEPTLYAGTIRFNILLGALQPDEEISQDELEAACRDANILDFIKSLPNGFETEVGNKGTQLSGGQKQRIAIARALMRDPKILLLDEATSALDSTSEKVVQAALDQAAKGRTTIAVAHRLSTIQNADCIFFVKEGVVSEAGTHEELLAKRGDYFDYVQLQSLGVTASPQ